MDLPAAFQQFSPIAGFDQLDQSNDGHIHIDDGFSFEDDMLELYEAFYPDTNPNNQGIMAGYPPPPMTSSPPQYDVSSQQLAALQSLQAQEQFQARQQNYYRQHQHQHQHQHQQVVPPRKSTGIRKKKKMEQLKTVYRVPADNILTVDKWAWRKYGQKPIKGSPYPRNYYRCSSSKGCTARKQVERSLTEPEVYVVTYTGDHFHPWPLHRNALAGISRSDHRHQDLCHVAPQPPPAPAPAPAPAPEEDHEGEALLIPNSKYVDEDMLRGMEELGKWKLTLNRSDSGSGSGSGSGLDGLGFY